MKKVAILQSNYIPWKGYFDIISKVDLFVFHDDLQYTKGDWRNRNRILTPNGPLWLTIPCGSNLKRLICEVELNDHSWQKKHWATIENNYRKAPYFNKYKDFFKSFYFDQNWATLSEANQSLIKSISKELLGLSTKFEDSRKYNLENSKAERVIELLVKTDADYYLSGPAAKDYLIPEMFKAQNIQLEYMDYSNYKEYQQLHDPFEHAVSIIDLVFNVGDEMNDYCIS